MALSTTSPPAAPNPFDLRIHTPDNLNRGARAALLQNSPAIANGPVSVSPRPGQTAQTPSSPLNAATTAAATEEAKLANTSSIFKLRLAFCAKFKEAAQQFTTGPQRCFAQQFADNFLDSWKRELSSDGAASKPTYSSVAAASPPAARGWPTHQQQQRRQNDPPHRQGRPATIAPPREDGLFH
ncbi:hypothetical protein AU210_012540 [Fusarium oxysporum f. sp. radicis-cucumerinum]|uniref:Uncharacterized protein n=2 Tax=Fusarium oxysporum TaxID=5507 RepID=A0A2H3GEW4_FUSOX|nr:hypothetical protein AU210_012540 [Fusarium oxysporum f. sp. radicis-cucumerinum]RKK10313.1 hypothetical protein BFJ65_g15611 [Fusarium oxysporum f. sp. cepae]RKK26798.1 hypothetical protein BFJ67_g16459 [Fusarium oxysporum f. sp. cepae]RKK35973.1 hypothetical protein BFJ66_g13717 [Fusarium oxysporum f. sp. cepae]